jgi:hypothetical protein
MKKRKAQFVHIKVNTTFLANAIFHFPRQSKIRNRRSFNKTEEKSLRNEITLIFERPSTKLSA